MRPIDDVDSPARRRRAATKASKESRIAETPAVDQAREVARRAFERIKAARARALKRVG